MHAFVVKSRQCVAIRHQEAAKKLLTRFQPRNFFCVSTGSVVLPLRSAGAPWHRQSRSTKLKHATVQADQKLTITV